MTYDKSLRKAIFEYAKEKYAVEPDFPWGGMPESGVLRHKENKKWFALVMEVKKKHLGLGSSEKTIDVINLKCEPAAVGFLLDRAGFLPAYHMNKKHWITILLDGSVPLEDIRTFIDVSYEITKK